MPAGSRSANTCRYASYGLVAGRVGDHFLGGYCDHVSKVGGREIVAEKLGLIRGANNETIAVPVAQDTPVDEVDIPTEPPTAAGADAAAADAAEALSQEIGGVEVVSATAAMDQMELADGALRCPLTTPLEAGPALDDDVHCYVHACCGALGAQGGGCGCSVSSIWSESSL